MDLRGEVFLSFFTLFILLVDSTQVKSFTIINADEYIINDISLSPLFHYD